MTIGFPRMIWKKSMHCWKVFRSLRLMVLIPAWVVAATIRNRESMYDTWPRGVEKCQNMTEDTMHIVMM